MTLRWALLVVLVTVAPSTALAQALHVFGPPGNGVRRRVLVVLERADGGCAPFDGVRLEASNDATVTLGEAAGQCARWADVRSSVARAEIVLRATRGDSSSEATVAMAVAPLVVRAERNGGELRVFVTGVPRGAVTRAAAVWTGGGTPLEPTSGGGYAGRVPEDAMIGVVVSAGDRSGAAGIAPRVQSGRPELLIAPSSLVLASGGAPRTAAYLLVADGHARLSRSVPLHVASSRGDLRALGWIYPGVASLTFSAGIGIRSVDLQVSAGPTRVHAELPAGAAWPAAATIAAPTQVERGAVATITVAATSADDQPVDPTSLLVRCDERDLVPDANGVVACPISATTDVIVRALIGGTRVPLAVRSIVAGGLGEGTSESPASVVSGSAASTPRAVRRPSLRVAVLTQAAIDLWTRPTIGAGGSLRVRVGRVMSLEAALRYQLTFVSSAGQGIVRDSLTGLAHAGEVAAGVRIAPFAGLPLEFFGAGGLAFSNGSAKVGATRVGMDALAVPILLGVGTTLQLGGVSLGIDVFARASIPVREVAWSEPWLRFGLEVSGGVDLAP